MATTDLSNLKLSGDKLQVERFDPAKGERARFVMPEPNVEVTHVHVFHSEEPHMVEKNGRQVQDWDRQSFAGMFICTGDEDLVGRNPKMGDPANCAACAAMHDPEKANLIEPARRTYATNVVRYSTKPGTYDLRNRNVEVQLWKHASDKKLQPIQMVAANSKRPLNEIDFFVEVDNTDWKGYTIQPHTEDAAYLQDEQLKQNVLEAVKDSLYDKATLIAACGKNLPKDELEAEVTMLYKQFNGGQRSGGQSDDGTLNLGGAGNDASLTFTDEGNGLGDVPVQEFSDLLNG